MSKQRVDADVQFQYLNARKAIAQISKDQKQVVLDITQRKKDLIELEDKTLQAENARRKVMGQKPYPNWESYQASMDALAESRAKMKVAQRPSLPEEETFVTEAANVLMDLGQLQKKH